MGVNHDESGSGEKKKRGKACCDDGVENRVALIRYHIGLTDRVTRCIYVNAKVHVTSIR